MSIRTEEHRWGARVEVDVPAQLIGPTRHVMTCRMKNFSAGGAFLEIDFQVPVMANITLMIRDNGRIRIRPQAIAGYVVRHAKGGIGIGWWSMEPVTLAYVVSAHEAVHTRAELAPSVRMPG